MAGSAAAADSIAASSAKPNTSRVLVIKAVTWLRSRVKVILVILPHTVPTHLAEHRVAWRPQGPEMRAKLCKIRNGATRPLDDSVTLVTNGSSSAGPSRTTCRPKRLTSSASAMACST